MSNRRIFALFFLIPASGCASGDKILRPHEVFSQTSTAVNVENKGDYTPWVFFGFNSAKLSNKARVIIKELSNIYKKSSQPQIIIHIIGFTDSAGAESYNYWLGKQRAKSVVQELKSLGWEAQQLYAESCGPNLPLVPAAVGIPEPQNRRVQIGVNLPEGGSFCRKFSVW